jgi:hypothetical protein
MKKINSRSTKIVPKFGIAQLLFVVSLWSITLSAFAGNAPSLMVQNIPSTTHKCTVNFGNGMKLHIPSTLTTDCDQGRKEIDTDFIAFFVHYPSLRLTAEGDPVPNTPNVFQIYVTSFYQNSKNNSSWGNWPSTYVKIHINEFGPINTYPTVYQGMFQIIPASAMKAHPDNDTGHAPGIFIANPHSENQFYIECSEPRLDGECTADVYNTRTHFEYQMHYPSIAIGQTINIVNAIAKTVDSWK